MGDFRDNSGLILSGNPQSKGEAKKRMFPDTDSLVRALETAYGLTKVVAKFPAFHRLDVDAPVWISSNGRRFVARFYSMPEGKAEIAYQASLTAHLNRSGIAAEEFVPTMEGRQYALVRPDLAIGLSAHHLGKPIPLPASDEDVASWALFVARMHQACESWEADVDVGARITQVGPATMLQQALENADGLPDVQLFLQTMSQGIQDECEALFNAGPAQAVHGDLWPGNLIQHDRAFRAVDFRDAGQGSRVIDVANAFRWMPWRSCPDTARRQWRIWLDAYSAVIPLPPLEARAIPSLACLLQVHWLNVEATAAMAGLPDYADRHVYVRDHRDALAALLRYGQEILEAGEIPGDNLPPLR